MGSRRPRNNNSLPKWNMVNPSISDTTVPLESSPILQSINARRRGRRNHTTIRPDQRLATTPKRNNRRTSRTHRLRQRLTSLHSQLLRSSTQTLRRLLDPSRHTTRNLLRCMGRLSEQRFHPRQNRISLWRIIMATNIWPINNRRNGRYRHRHNSLHSARRRLHIHPRRHFMD